jgi:hypothetical protein
MTSTTLNINQMGRQMEEAAGQIIENETTAEDQRQRLT